MNEQVFIPPVALRCSEGLTLRDRCQGLIDWIRSEPGVTAEDVERDVRDMFEECDPFVSGRIETDPAPVSGESECVICRGCDCDCWDRTVEVLCGD